MTFAEESTTTVPQLKPKNQEPVVNYFNLSGHKWEDMIGVFIDNILNWTDTKRSKSKPNICKNAGWSEPFFDYISSFEETSLGF